LCTAAKKYVPASCDHLGAQGAAPPKLKRAKPVPVEPAVNSSNMGQRISDLLVPAEKIRHFAEIDLGKLANLPSRRQDLVALSIRIEAAFTSLWNLVLAVIAEDHEDIPLKTLDAVASSLALDFIERYGALAMLSGSILKVLWEAQRPKSENGPKRLREVGQRLAIFAMAGKGINTRQTIGIAFTLCKRSFLTELQQLSRELGASDSDTHRADQMLALVGTEKYPMLRMNLSYLEQFLRCQQVNPYLRAKNEVASERLARYGARGLTIQDGPSMTPDWFFYTWIGWATNKSPRTVRKELQTAETRFKNEINSLSSGYK